ncbi:uncharacterized protein PG986_004418 [Apiospora aurea]|uniref:Cyanovirin-N domain-containing protein n=1 Tax=Apiospora aurea TaxID=335848 RepID=A0ABR1QMJ5_9PEZI
MKLFTQLLSLLELFLSVAADDTPPYGAPGGLQCRDIKLVDGPAIWASCPVNFNGTMIYLCGTMNINQCFANQDGFLAARENGGAANSCNNCQMSGTILQCDCLINTQTTLRQTSHIDTDVAIVNDGGGMKCYNQTAKIALC